MHAGHTDGHRHVRPIYWGRKTAAVGRREPVTWRQEARTTTASSGGSEWRRVGFVVSGAVRCWNE